MSKTAIHTFIQRQIQGQIGEKKLFLEKQVVPGRIADCVWEEESIVFEVQVSPLTRQEALLRTSAYREFGYEVVWILHEKTFGGPMDTAAEKALATIPHYYTNADELTRGAIYDKLFFKQQTKSFLQETSFVNLSCPIRSKASEKNPLRALWRIHFAGDYTLKKTDTPLLRQWIDSALFIHKELLDKWVKDVR